MAKRVLPRDATAAGLARDFLTDQLIGVTAEARRDAALLVSELVTNAVRHGAGEIAVQIHHDTDHVRVEVVDEGHAAPLAPRLEPGANGGFGLHLVDKLSDGWGVDPPEMRVWFLLRVAA